MKAEVITIGDELLIGQVVDTNSAWMGEVLNQVGIKINRITSISDEREEILNTLTEASSRAQLVLITGGLGPTNDDITKKTLADYFNTTMRFDEQAFQDVIHLFSIRGKEVSALNRLQAEVPQNCTTLYNKVGTAPGMWFDENEVVYVSMPGVPYEMKYLMEQEVIPRLKTRFKTPLILHSTILTFGIGESFLAEKIAGFEKSLPTNIKLAYLPSAGSVRLRLTGTGVKEEELKMQIKNLTQQLVEIIPEYIYGYGKEELPEVVGRLLKQKCWTLATAESCSGGYMAHLITSIPGSSAYYMGSSITYSNQSKTQMLGIPAELIEKHGAVSEQVVVAMVESVKNLFKVDCAVATTGVAGPGGGTPEKPVGTVWVGVSTPAGTKTYLLKLGDNRLRTIEVAALSGLNLLRKEILQKGN
ncbi:MAG: competence/damage-inducible protein A [Bacteroidota bacterium]